jgi:hypothetical protein
MSTPRPGNALRLGLLALAVQMLAACAAGPVLTAPAVSTSTASPVGSAAQSAPPAVDTVTIDMGSPTGAPTYQASGFIYGLSPDADSPAQSLLSDIKVRYLRVGGAQLGCPDGGWINSPSNYQVRWNAVKAYYARAQAIGAIVQILPHDLWGADGVCPVAVYPGDGDDWTTYTKFMTQVLDDAKAAGMTGPNVQWDVWNEPDCCGFYGGRLESQYLAMWTRGYQQIRAAIPGATIVGPSFAGQPDGNWFPRYLDFVKANNVVPDVFSWHEETGNNDPVFDKMNMDNLLKARGIPHPNPYDVNEYGTASEQNPGHSAWYLARFNRTGMAGLRGNWAMGSGLWGGMGGLTTSDGRQLGQWWIYKRYADITGQIVSVTPGKHVDAVAGTDPSNHRALIIAGNDGGGAGPVNIVIQNVPSYLLSNGKATHVLVEKMPAGTTVVTAPTVVLDSPMEVSRTSLTVTIDWSPVYDGYAITLTSGTN